MVEELKPLQLGIAGGIVLAFFMFFMGMMGTCSSTSQGYYGMMGMMGYGYSLIGSLLGLVYGAITGFAGGAGIAIIYNFLNEKTKQSKE